MDWLTVKPATTPAMQDMRYALAILLLTAQYLVKHATLRAMLGTLAPVTICVTQNLALPAMLFVIRRPALCAITLAIRRDALSVT
jgi:hypothetical protein